jgi:hypothetical protein
MTWAAGKKLRVVVSVPGFVGLLIGNIPQIRQLA